MRATLHRLGCSVQRSRRRAAIVALVQSCRAALAERIERVERLDHEELGRVMREGYAAEAAAPSLDRDWTAIEIEGWV